MSLSSNKSGIAVGYAFTRIFGNQFIPVAIQNKLIRDYCSKKNLLLSLPVVESYWKNCFHQLFSLCEKIESNDHIILYSAAMMPSDYKYSIVKKMVLQKNITFHFIQENVEGILGQRHIELTLLDYKLRKYIGVSKYKEALGCHNFT
jgi:sporadic carbohydrate cluster protein (TIGR04323 family)